MSYDSTFLQIMNISGFAHKNDPLKGQDIQVKTQNVAGDCVEPIGILLDALPKNRTVLPSITVAIFTRQCFRFARRLTGENS
jgi:hypothetical protein